MEEEEENRNIYYKSARLYVDNSWARVSGSISPFPPSLIPSLINEVESIFYFLKSELHNNKIVKRER